MEDIQEFLMKFKVFDFEKGRFSSRDCVYDNIPRNVMNIAKVSPTISLFYSHLDFPCNIDSHWRIKYGDNEDYDKCREHFILIGYTEEFSGQKVRRSFLYYQSDHTVILNNFVPSDSNRLTLPNFYLLLIHGCNLINNGHGPNVPLKIWITCKHPFNILEQCVSISDNKFWVSEIYRLINYFYCYYRVEVSTLDLRIFSSPPSELEKSITILQETNRDSIPVFYLSVMIYWVLKKFQFSIDVFGSLPFELCFAIAILHYDLYYLRSKDNELYVRSKEDDDRVLLDLKEFYLSNRIYGKNVNLLSDLDDTNYYLFRKPIFTWCEMIAQREASLYDNWEGLVFFLKTRFPLYLEYYGDFIKMKYEQYRISWLRQKKKYKH